MDINSVLRGIGANANKGLANLDNNTTRKADGKFADAGVATLASNTEKVTLTNTASRLGQLAQQNGSDSQINSERIASLRAAIADGSYQPNPASIAARLTSFESQMRG